MPPRFFVDQPLQAAAVLTLPPGAARHVQVLRLQPGDALTLFNGQGGEWAAVVTRMGRSEVEVQLGAHAGVDRELAPRITLALGMPANDRMDALVEKATELGAVAIQPLVCERSVLRLAGERADKKVAHWRGVAVAAAEQCGRTRVPEVAAVRTLADWLRTLADDGTRRCVLSLRSAPVAPAATAGSTGAAASVPASAAVPLLFLSGPEGGLTEAEEAAALTAGFTPVSLGPRVLRADTAPLAALVAFAACHTLPRTAE